MIQGILNQNRNRVKRKPKKPSENLNKPFFYTNWNMNDCYSQRKYYNSLYRPCDPVNIARDYLDFLTPAGKRIFAFNFIAQKALRYVGFSRNKIASFLGVSTKTLDRALKNPVFRHVSGKKTYNSNRYFVDPIFLHNKLRKKVIKCLLLLPDFISGSVITKCPTSIKNIVLKVVYKIREYINFSPHPYTPQQPGRPTTVFSQKTNSGLGRLPSRRLPSSADNMSTIQSKNHKKVVLSEKARYVLNAAAYFFERRILCKQTSLKQTNSRI